MSPPPPNSPYISLTRDAWAALRADTPLPLSEDDLEALRGITSAVDLDEVESIYLPLTRLLNLYVTAAQELHIATQRFLGHRVARVPYIIGIAGSVAAGKSTFARILRTLLARWPNSPRVDLVTTDGFLWPNATLEARGIMHKKGFPESYDQPRLIDFVSHIKAGEPRVSSPVYSHITYDIVADQAVVIERPDIVLIEGLNVLQPSPSPASRPFVSDFFDFSIYLDAPLPELRAWYKQRFLKLRDTAFQNPSSYFHRYASLSDHEALALAEKIWREINELNLHENILPTRERADLILHKRSDHAIHEILLRKL